MRISDWSSDVCSSDLLAALGRRFGIHLRRVLLGAQREGLAMELRQLRLAVDAGDALHEWARQLVLGVAGPVHQARRNTGKLAVAVGLGELLGAEIDAIALPLGGRSEEHTSELQSLMRISYAVFC